MLAWIFACPLILGVILVGTAWLESNVVEPVERAVKIKDLLSSAANADEVEQRATEILSTVVPARGRNPHPTG